MNPILQALLADDNWFPVVTPICLLAVAVFVVLARRRRVPGRLIAVSALNLFFGLWIGIMGAGHLFGVTTKAALGVLPPNIRLWIAIPFGFAIAVPGWWLVLRVNSLLRSDRRAHREATWLNAWLAAALVVPAWPLVVPPLINLVALARTTGTARGSPANSKAA